MTEIDAGKYKIHIGDLVNSEFEDFLNKNYKDSKIVVLVDENTHEHCLNALIENFDIFNEAEIVMMPHGEENKVLEICGQVWETLLDFQLGRKDLLINLGGGVVSDLGGFVASVYKRGIDFINIPTSLLAMVDASIGGKTGIDVGPFKNVIGTFNMPLAVFVDKEFLRTLPQLELLNGYAEMLKHGLIADLNYWNELVHIRDYTKLINDDLIEKSIQIKNEIVLNDPEEKNERKKLNFGHTVGHALEGFFLNIKKISHGHAVGLGMLVESFISYRKNLLSKKEFKAIENLILESFPLVYIEDENLDAIYEIMLNDKKNDSQDVSCVLLKAIGVAVVDQHLSKLECIEGLIYLKNLNINLN